MRKFLSCDWGTSSFRLRLVEITDVKIIAEENSDQGIAKIFESWRGRKEPGHDRFIFYLNVIRRHIEALQTKLNASFDNIPLAISGMACSTIGMTELPYKEIPFSTNGSDLVTKLVKSNNDFKHDIIFISGAKTERDVMRGEETQLVGCSHNEGDGQVFIFPGTHSKHVMVENGRVVDIKTFMTGEFFELLSSKSILSASVEKTEGLTNEKIKKSFEEGVKESLHSNLLNSSFKVRTNDLFDKLSQQENYHFLSGLLIGTEMKEVAANECEIILVSNSHLCSQYETAFNLIVNNTRKLKIQDADKAIVEGQLKILNRVVT